MPGFDVFEGNAFTMQSLTAAVLERKHVPMRLGAIPGLFETSGVRTTKVSVEKRGQTLVLVQTTPRGAPAVQNTTPDRELIDIPSARIALEDTVTADEVQNIRAFGSESELQTLVGEIADRNASMSDSILATEEYHRIGAVKGRVLDADGSTLIDLFQTFNVAEPAEIDFDLDNANPAEGALRRQCAVVVRAIQDVLEGVPYTGIHAMVSSQFWDDLLAHREVRETVKNWPAALTLRESGVGRGGNGQPIRTLDFGGITWEEYRGRIGATDYVEDDKARFFPVGVPRLFLTRYAPAEYFDTVNTVGLPRYATINPDGTDPKHKRTLRVQSHPVMICTRPGVLQRARRT